MASKKAKTAYQLKVTLNGVRPPIWRRVVVPGAFTLEELHWVIQFAMGWTHSHLHQFVVKAPAKNLMPADVSRPMRGDVRSLTSASMRSERVFSIPSMELEDTEDETRVRLDAVAPNEKDRFRYEYDFGDGWDHDVLVEKVTPLESKGTYPRCLAGKRRCPPEDCGGPWGYAEMLAALADPSHERHKELAEWIGGTIDPEEFDVEAVNDAFRDVDPD